MRNGDINTLSIPILSNKLNTMFEQTTKLEVTSFKLSSASSIKFSPILNKYLFTFLSNLLLFV